MKEIIESLSLESGAVFVAIVSAIVTVGMNRIFNLKFKWAIILSIPFFVANALYWSPVLLGSNSSEYAAWAPLFIIPWYVVGMLSSSLLGYIINKQRHENKRQ
jgi:hypothetical protein